MDGYRRRTMAGLLAATLAILAGPAVSAAGAGPVRIPRSLGGPAGLRPRGKVVPTLQESAPSPSPEDRGEELRPFDASRAAGVASRLEAMRDLSAEAILGPEAFAEAISLMPEFRASLDLYATGAMQPDELRELEERTTRLENLEGLVLKGRHRPASMSPPPGERIALPRDRDEVAEGTDAHLATVTKVNTGWILDRHVWDTTVGASFPTLLQDWRTHDETSSDIVMGGNEGGASLVWQVHAFTWTDTASVTDHANASSCLAIMYSGDGGTSWFLYTIYYDPTGAGHTTSLDMINPRIALDITVVPNRVYLAYEMAYSTTDHDIYVLSFNEDGSGGLDSPIATSALMERNPAIASDYTTGQVPYQVVSFEKETQVGSIDYDIWAAQCATSAGGQLLVNPGFESGNVSWNASNASIISTGQAHSGTYDAKIGTGTGSPFTDSIYQDVVIPAGATASLSLWLKITTTDGTTNPYDYFYVQVRNTSNAVLATLLTLDNRNQPTYAAYTQLTYDLSAYAGTTARIYLYSTNDVSNITSFYVDDLALTVSGSYAWTTALDVTGTTGAETNPALSAATSGGSSFTAYMHLAYNYDTYGAGTQLLLSPGFESPLTGWVLRVAGDVSCSGTNQHTGTCKAWLGGTVSQPNDWIYQQIALPSDALAIQFSYWLKIATTDGTTTPYDYLNVEIRDSAGTLLKSLITYSNVDQLTYGSYGQVFFNLLEFRGQTIRIHMWASNDSANTTSFYIDDTAVTVIRPSDATAHEIRYAKASHPVGTPYPTALQSFAKITVLNDWLTWGTTAAFGPPTIAASHGGAVSPALTAARVVVAAERYAPAGKPGAGDPARYQIFTAWNTNNGTALATSCGSSTLGWNKSYFYESKSDQRYPSLVADGMGWVGAGQNGVAGLPYIYMAYYSRDQSSPKSYGEVQMILTDASDESCADSDGSFPEGTWFYFTYNDTATDGDGLSYAAPRTLTAFVYWFFPYPGVAFHKMISHPGGYTNMDPYMTTLGENYTLDTLAASGPYRGHIDALMVYGDVSGEVSFVGPFTFPWAAGYEMPVSTDKTFTDGTESYNFTLWDFGPTSPDTTITTGYTAPDGSMVCGLTTCPPASVNALFSGTCLASYPEVTNHRQTKSSSNVSITWNAVAGAVQYIIYRAASPTAASNYIYLGATTSTSYTDTGAPDVGVNYYLVVAQCGLWGHYGQ